MHVLLAAALLAIPAADDSVKLKLIPDGGMKMIGFYAPQRVKLAAERPAGLTKAPEGLKAPLYGEVMIGQAGPDGKGRHFVIVDEPAGEPARLFIDTNANGDLTDDQPAEWTGRPAGMDGERELTMYGGTGKVLLTAGASEAVSLGLYRFDPTDPKREGLKDVLLYYRDYAREGKISLDGKEYRVVLNDNLATGDFRGKELAADAGEKESSGIILMIDLNDNGKFDKRGETFDVRKPFNIGGTTYELTGIAADGSGFRVVESEKTVAEIPLAPDHSVGKPITAFTAATTDGKTVKFPEDYKGKIVMIDFWATWCGPCMKEVPGLVEVYNKYHDQGFEVLGISLDNEKTKERLKPVTEEKGMTWRQVCDGKYWDAEIAKMYVVQGIPACWLVDGDTGTILATEGQLRGESLEKTIQAAIEKKKGG